MSRKPSLLPKPLSRMSSGGTITVNSESPGASSGSAISSNSVVEIVKSTDEQLPARFSLSEVEVRCKERELTAPLITVKNNRELNSDGNKNAFPSTKIASRSRKANVVAAKVPVIESVFFKQSGHVKLGTRATKPLGDSAINVSNVQCDVRKPSNGVSKSTIDESRVAADVKKSTSDISSRVTVQNVVTYRNGSGALRKIPSQTDVKKRPVLIVSKQSVADSKCEYLINNTAENITEVVGCTAPSMEIPSSTSEQFPIQNPDDTGVLNKSKKSNSVDETTGFTLDVSNGMEQCALVNAKIKSPVLSPKATDKLANTKPVVNISRVSDLPKSGRKPAYAFGSRPISGLDGSEGQTPASARPISAPGTSANGGLSLAQRRLNLSASKSNLKALAEANTSVSKSALPAGGSVRPEVNPSAQRIPTALPNKFGKLPTTSKLAITRTSISNLRQKPNEQKLSVLKPARSVSNIAKRDVAMSIAPTRKDTTTKSPDHEKNSKSSSRPSSLYAEKPNPNNNHHRSSLDLNVTYVEHFQSVNIPLTTDDSHAVAIASPSEFVLKSSDVCSAMGCAEEAGSSSTIVMTSKDATRSSSTSKLPVELKRRQVPRTSSAGVTAAAAGRATSRHSDAMIIRNDNFCDSNDSPKPTPSDARCMLGTQMLSCAVEKLSDSDSSGIRENCIQHVDNIQNIKATNVVNAESVDLPDVMNDSSLEDSKNITSAISTNQSRASLTNKEVTNISEASALQSYSEMKENVIISSVSHISSRRSSSSSSLSSSSSSTSPASKSTDTVVDSASSESLYSNPEPTSGRSEPEKKLPIQSGRTFTNGTLIEQPLLSSVPRRPNSITLCSSSVQQSSSNMTSAKVNAQTNRNKHVSTSNLDQVRPSASRSENFKHIQRIENFGRTATIREHLPQASDGVEHHSTQRSALSSYYVGGEGYSAGLHERRPSQEGNFAGPNIFENKHLNHIRRPNSVDNYSSSSTLSASNCGSEKAVSEPRRLLQTNKNWSGFENYKIKPAEINTQSNGNNESASNKILMANTSCKSSFVSSSVSAPVIQQSVDEADPNLIARGRYCSSIKSNVSETSSSIVPDNMQTNRKNSTENANQFVIDYVNSPRTSRLPMKSKLVSTNIRTKTAVVNDQLMPQFSGPSGIDPILPSRSYQSNSSGSDKKIPPHGYQASSSDSDRIMPPHSYRASSSGSERVTIGSENKSTLRQSSSEVSRSEEYANDMLMTKTNSDQKSISGHRKDRSNENNTDRAQSSLNSTSQAKQGKDFTPKVVRRSIPESTIVQPKLVKPYTAASAAGRNSAFSLANVKRNVATSAQVTVAVLNAESAANKQNLNSLVAGGQGPIQDQMASKSVKLKADEFPSSERNQWITDDGNKSNQVPYQNNGVRNQGTDSISSSRIRNSHTSSVNINLTTSKDYVPFKDASNQSQRSSGLFMDLKNRTSSERDHYCHDESVVQDSLVDNCSKLNIRELASKNMESSYFQLPAGSVKCDGNLNVDVLNEYVCENPPNNCTGDLTYTSDSQTSQTDSATIGENHMYPVRTDKYKAVTRDKIDNCIDLTTSESEKDSIRNSRSSIYAKLVPNGGKTSKNDSLVLERLDADGANKEELFVITYESDDIIVLERRGGNGSSLTSSTREIQDSPTDVVGGHHMAMNRKDGVEDVRRPLPDEFSATEVISPELQQRGLPVSESGYDSWKSDGPNDPTDSRSSSRNFSSVTARNLQPHNHGNDVPCDVGFQFSTSKSGDIDSSFVEPGNRAIATSKPDYTVTDECNDETRKESVDFFSGSSVNKPIRVARLSPVQFRSFLKSNQTNARCERINDVTVENNGCSMATGSSILSSKGIFSFVDVIKEDAANETNPSCDKSFSSKLFSKNRSRTSGDNLDEETNNVGFVAKHDYQNNRNCRNGKTERNYCWNESNKNRSIDCDESSAARLKTEKPQRQDTYYENVCDDVLESFEGNMSDWENF